VIVAGGISVKDPGGHDKSAYNFIYAAGRAAKEALARNKKDASCKVVLVLYSEPYKRRAVADGKSPDYYINKIKDHATTEGYEVKEVANAQGVADEIGKCKNITNIEYYGHSNKDRLFYEYSSTPATNAPPAGGPAVSNDHVGADSFKGLPFAPGAMFKIYGCCCGEPWGIAEQLSKQGFNTEGALGKTDYVPVGQGHTRPAAPGGTRTYPAVPGASPTPAPAPQGP
jgi:hypothetical protein